VVQARTSIEDAHTLHLYCADMTRPTSPDLTAAWTAVITWLEHQVPELRADLNPPASEAALARLERRLGHALPDHWHALYRLADGQRGEASGLFYGAGFLSLEEVADQWQVWRDLSTEPDVEASFQGRVSPPGAIRNRYIELGWIPFAHDGGGNHLGVDLAPGESGTVGQVLTFGRDVTHKVVVAPDLAGFLAWFAGQLQAENVRLVPAYEAGQGQALLLQRPPSEDFIGELPGLLGYV
jgi:cell wall assembly regulator SMI1